jgi:hypothetical protein
MKLVDRWRQIEETLPAGWQEVTLVLAPEDAADLPRASAVLGPLNPGRRGETLVFTVRRAGGPASPEAARRLFRKLDEIRCWSTLELLDVEAAEPTPAARDGAVRSITASWDAALSTLPPDWSDLLCRLELDSSDYLARAALLCAPINPTRDTDALAFLFRCARRAGYGVSPGMARRCFERCDEEGITGRASVLRVLSGTDNVATQGPVWYVGGKVL